MLLFALQKRGLQSEEGTTQRGAKRSYPTRIPRDASGKQQAGGKNQSSKGGKKNASGASAPRWTQALQLVFDQFGENPVFTDFLGNFAECLLPRPGLEHAYDHLAWVGLPHKLDPVDLHRVARQA